MSNPSQNLPASFAGALVPNVQQDSAATIAMYFEGVATPVPADSAYHSLGIVTLSGGSDKVDLSLKNLGANALTHLQVLVYVTPNSAPVPIASSSDFTAWSNYGAAITHDGPIQYVNSAALNTNGNT